MGICKGRRVSLHGAGSDNAKHIASVLAAAGASVVESGADVVLNFDAGADVVKVNRRSPSGDVESRISASDASDDQQNMAQALAWFVSEGASHLPSLDVELRAGGVSVSRDGEALGTLNKGCEMTAYEIGLAIETLMGRA